MLETRNRGYALVACLALITAACGAVAPGEEQVDTGDTSSDAVGCAPGSKDGTCGGTDASGPTEAQCKDQYQGCLAKGVGEQMCRSLFSQCMATVPPPAPPPPPPSSEDQCFMGFRFCYDATGQLDACYAQLKICLGRPPPPPPPPPLPPPSPSPEEQCKLEYSACVQRTGDEPACRSRYQLCLESIPKPAP